MEYFILAIAILLFGSIVLFFIKNKYKSIFTTIVSFIASLTILIPVFKILTTGKTLSFYIVSSSLFGSIPLEITPLSAIFIILIAIMSFLTIFYSIGYLKPYIEQKKDITSHYFFLLWLVASMFVVVTIKHSIGFLFAWEIMSLSSFFLVIFEGEKKEILKAGIKYLVYMHLSVIFLIIMFGLLINETNSYLFSSYSEILQINLTLSNLVFIVGFIGFGIKAGFIPFHNWLPSAHPAAPSHVSALMSGVMIKTGIYGILQLLYFIKTPSIEISYMVLVIAVISALYGILYAITQKDIKRILACSSIENMGIITIGIAIAMFGMLYNNTLLTVLGITGAVLHTVNHSIFKVLMFLNAGNIYTQTHTRNIEKLGGLIKLMPYTSSMTIIGTLAISGLPLFNGFISEFIIYISLLLSLPTKTIGLFITLILTFGCLALVGALAVLCFSRFVGISTLGEKRSLLSVKKDVSISMLAPLFILSTLIVVIGIFPQSIIKPLKYTIKYFVSNEHFSELYRSIITISITLSQILLILLSIIILVLGLKLFIRNKSTIHVTWGCGYDQPNEHMQYTASSFANPFLTMIKHLFKRVSHIKKPKDLFPKDAYYEQNIEDIEEAYIVNPLIKLDEKFLTKFERIQNGNIQQYILFGLIFLIIAILGVITIG